MHVLVLLLRCTRQNKVMCELYTIHLRCVKCRELRSIIRKLCEGGAYTCAAKELKNVTQSWQSNGNAAKHNQKVNKK